MLAALQSVYDPLRIQPALVGTLGTKQYLACDGSKQARDRCLAKCPAAAKWVCGSNGKSYPTKCAAQCHGASPRKSGKC